MTLDDVGKWPMSGEEARRKPVKHFLITRRDALKVVQGKDRYMLVSFFVSNDYINLAMIELPSGGNGVRASEPEVHKGDEVLYALNGSMTVFLTKTEETFVVNEGEAFYIPEGIKHQYVNFTDKVVKSIQIIAPEL